MPPVARSLNPFRALVVHRNYRRFWIGQTVSLIGTWMQLVAQGWLALELSNDPLLVGLVAAAGSFPVLLLSLPAGVLADRMDKLRLVKLAQAGFLLQAAALWWMVWSGRITIEWLVLLATVSGILQAIDVPARQSLIVELVGRDDLLDAIALNSSGFNLARIVGPSLAALVIATVGLSEVFAVNALSYGAVLGGLWLIRLPPWQREQPRLGPWEGMREGLRYVRSTPNVATLLRLTAVYSVFGLPYLTLMPVFARDVLGLDASGYGALLSVVGIGAITGALSLAALAPRSGRGRLLAVGALSFASLLVLFSFTRSPLMAGAVLLATGFTMILTNAVTNGLLQTIAPDEYRGRVMSVYSLLFIGVSPVGSVLAGAVARTFGVSLAIGASAMVMLGFGIWTFARHPELRQL